MPNWVTNKITASAPVITAIREKCCDEQGRMDFNRLIRMPDHQPECFYADGGLAAENERANPRGNWYEWANRCWGTKWNATTDPKALHRNGRTTILFETAWAFPMPICCALAAALPTLSWRWEYADEDIGNNLGVVDIVDGAVTFAPDPADRERWAWALRGYPEHEFESSP